ncbi:hypothetical protein GDO86_017989 [Hymenochirus boettgeri]|uniref:Uncharacterized protein n=1 Tax=Hymenochirus boettgeri TaxID=247094 RepID=A0A8T2IHT4_9PIPI|nr:hypothetical protein GDO86_017989 [Hymenochirus boettgeri]
MCTFHMRYRPVQCGLSLKRNTFCNILLKRKHRIYKGSILVITDLDIYLDTRLKNSQKFNLFLVFFLSSFSDSVRLLLAPLN